MSLSVIFLYFCPFFRNSLPLADPKKILVIRLSSIGDIILTTPLLRSLKKKFPTSQVTFLIKKQYAELLQYSPYVDRLISFDQAAGLKGWKAIASELRNEGVEVLLDIHKNLRSVYMRSRLKPALTGTYSKQIWRRSLLILTGIDLYGKVKPVYLRYFESASRLGVTDDGLGTEISFGQEHYRQAMDVLKKNGYNGSQPLVAICPAATFTNKRWLPERFAETAAFLSEKLGAFVVLLGGPADKELCAQISGMAYPGCVNLAGTLSLGGSAALLKLAALVIANDSGLLHLAQSQKTPAIGIYGPTTRQLGYFPIEKLSRVIETRVSCRPCTHNGLNRCPRKHFKCMRDIQTSSVVEAAGEFLGQKSRNP